MLTARTDVTDRMLIFSERHLRIVMAEYARHYNGRRSHRAPAPATPARPPRSRSCPGTDQAPARPRRPPQRIRTDRLKAQVTDTCTVLAPHNMIIVACPCPQPCGFTPSRTCWTKSAILEHAGALVESAQAERIRMRDYPQKRLAESSETRVWVPETLSWPLTWCLLPGPDRQVRHLAATEPYIQAL